MSFNLNIEHLSDKAFLKESNILKKSFEYALANICKEYSELESIKDFSSFNKKNKFSKHKLILYPFFVSTSNGHSEALFELFGKFYAPTVGPVSLEIIRFFFIDNNESDFFKFNDFNVEVKHFERFKYWDQIIDSIVNSEIKIDNDTVLFKDLMIKKDEADYNELRNAIDSGIKTLKEQSNNNFFTFSENDLKYQSYKYDAFSSKVDNDDKSIVYQDIKKDKKKLPFYANQ